ncbi:MAG: hypothetical protein ACKO37_08015 [Vampirovibrionales bacterium]
MTQNSRIKTVLSIQTENVKIASEIIERLTGTPPYKNKSCEHNVGVFDADDNPNLQFSVTIESESSGKPNESWKDVITFLKVAGEIATKCHDVNFTTTTIGNGCNTSAWVGSVYKKTITRATVDREMQDQALRHKLSKIESILNGDDE